MSRLHERTDIRICELKPFDPNNEPRFYSVSVPAGARVDEIVLSPDGTRIAWLFQFAAPKHAGEPYNGEDRVEVWVSAVDGSNLHPLLSQKMPYPEMAYSSSSKYPRFIRWVPGGNELSLLYDDSLYVLPVREQTAN